MALSKIVNAGFQLMFIACAGPLFACSVPMCLGPGPGSELAPSFTVALHREGRPLAGAKITLAGKGKEHVVETGPDGTFRFSGLASGDYSLSAQYLGLSVAWQCFHVRTKPSRKARGSVTFGWNYDFIELSTLQGSIVDNNRWRTPRLPVPSIELALRDFRTTKTIALAKSGEDGRFRFVELPEGEYVLVSFSGLAPSGIEVDESRQLIRLKSGSTRDELKLAVGNTTCGAYLQPER
jgi:hypothetical protein